MNNVTFKPLDDAAILQIIHIDCAPLPNERDSIYINFYRFFRDTCRVAMCGEEVVGFALGMVDQTNPDYCYLHYLFVKSAHRKTGIAQRLLQQFEQAAKQKGCRVTALQTSTQENVEYYKKHGYETGRDAELFAENDAVYDYYCHTRKVYHLAKTLSYPTDITKLRPIPRS